MITSIYIVVSGIKMFLRTALRPLVRFGILQQNNLQNAAYPPATAKSGTRINSLINIYTRGGGMLLSDTMRKVVISGYELCMDRAIHEAFRGRYE